MAHFLSGSCRFAARAKLHDAQNVLTPNPGRVALPSIRPGARLRRAYLRLFALQQRIVDVPVAWTQDTLRAAVKSGLCVVAQGETT